MAPQKTKPPPSKLREASASAVILRQRNPWRSQGLPTKDVCTPSGTPIRKIRIGMGAGLNCWRLLLLVRGARICEIPDDAEMKGHHRICHLKDGTVSGMKLISTSGDVALDRGAWGGITGCNPFPPLPSEFSASYIALRFSFYYNPQKADLDAAPASQRGQSSSKSGIKVSISPPDSGAVAIGRYRKVRSGGRYGDGISNIGVKWSVIGMDCSGTACGIASGDMYLARKVLPSPPSVVSTATSEVDLNRYHFGYRSACETNFLPLASLDQRNVAGNGPT
jgi:hypothetical protein